MAKEKTRFVIILCCAAALISACATPDGPRTVAVPVAVQCVPSETPSPPELRNIAQIKHLGDHALVLRIAAEWYELRAWASLVAPILDACRGP